MAKALKQMDKNKFIELSKDDKNQFLALLAIDTCKKGLLTILPINTFWHSTLENLYSATSDFYYGGKAKSIAARYNLLLLAPLIYIPFFSPLKFWYALIAVVASVFIVNKLRTNSFRNYIVEVALDSPYGFMNMWNYKLMGLMVKNSSGSSIYDTVVSENRWQDIVLSMLGWHDLMEQKIQTKDEYFEEHFPK